MDTVMAIDESCTTQHFSSECLEGDCDLKELVSIARTQHEAIRDGEQALAINYWRLGGTLNRLRQNFDHGQWDCQLKSLDIEKTKASRARAIASTFDTEAQVAGMTVKQAYDHRVRKQSGKSKASVADDERSRKLCRFLKNVTKTADNFMDFAGFAEASDADALLATVEAASSTLQRLHDLLRQQAHQEAEPFDNAVAETS